MMRLYPYIRRVTLRQEMHGKSGILQSFLRGNFPRNQKIFCTSSVHVQSFHVKVFTSVFRLVQEYALCKTSSCTRVDVMLFLDATGDVFLTCCRWCYANQEKFKNKSVHEIGSGCGLVNFFEIF